jgi:glycosyltransferase involved in cell wall biosynthesis
MNKQRPPLHIGIYGDYGFSPRPDEGIGVFLFNLIPGLLDVDPNTRITLWVHPGEEHQMQRLLRAYGERVQVYPPPRLPWLGWFLDGIDTLRHRLQVVFLGRTSDRLQQWFIHRWKARRGLARLGLLLALGLLTPLAWCVAILHHLLVHGVLNALAFPAELLLRSRGQGADLPPQPTCDVWLVPHGRTCVKLNAPEVLILWDVCHHHVSGVFGSEVQELTDELFLRRARNAALICCGAQSVLNDDLRRLYPFAEDRLRCVPLAPPTDLTAPSAARLQDARRRFDLQRPFVFYPAAVRAHKNHVTLIRALAWLHAHGTNVELVCTGKGEASSPVQTVLVETGMTPHVRFLGLLDRADIAALYRLAAVAAVPSLHEGYGLPVMEALASGCPLVCADIPALRELLAGHEDAVALFDPRDPVELGAAIQRTLGQRADYRLRQREVYSQLAQRDWRSVAGEYLDLFHEARALTEWREPVRANTEGVLAHG